MTHDRYEIPGDYVPNRCVQYDGAGSYWTRERIALSARYQYEVYAIARRLADELRMTSIVDVGCGTAVKLARFFAPRFAVHGVDAAEGVAVARRMCPGGTFAAADLDSAELDLDVLLPAARKELVVCADVIEHLAHPEHLLDAIRRFATSRTRIVLSTPDRARLAGLQARAPSVPEHVREWTPRELARFLERSGFVVLEQHLTYPFRFGVDRMTARFLANRLRTRLPLRTNQVVTCRIT